MLFRSKSPSREQPTRQDVADWRIKQSVFINVVITALVAVAVSWTIRHGMSMPRYTDALVLGLMFACLLFAAGYQHREVQRGRGSRSYFRALAGFAAVTGFQCVAQFFDGTVKLTLMIAGLVFAVPVLYLMFRAYNEQRSKVAD